PAGATPQAAPGVVAPAPAAPLAHAGAASADPHWADVDPNQLGVPEDAALGDFQAQQQQRDAELMQHDAEEAGAMRADDRRDSAREDRATGLDDEPRDDPYDEPPPELPPDDFDRAAYDGGPYDEPPPYDEGEPMDEPLPDEPPFDEPPFDEGRDPRDDYPRR
ncbi:MAG: hypothetical protein ABI588_02185, partial [Arenimonas sp.]